MCVLLHTLSRFCAAKVGKIIIMKEFLPKNRAKSKKKWQNLDKKTKDIMILDMDKWYSPQK